MTYDITTIIRDARIAQGLNPQAEQAWIPDAVCRQLTPDMAIERRIEQAARAVCSEADDALLAECVATIDAVPAFTDDHSGCIVLPADFMRLCVFWMNDWERPVRKAIDIADENYLMQRCRYPGLRGNPQRPVCAIVCAQGGLQLEFYGYKTRKANIKTALYHPYPSIRDGQLINMPASLYPAMIDML